jgi:hypothetical protein
MRQTSHGRSMLHSDENVRCASFGIIQSWRGSASEGRARYALRAKRKLRDMVQRKSYALLMVTQI